ncbi:diguanylate cyclase domain-containing protein [Psychrobium sp. 1_MG-2023]|uniref:diguanylate cyclase domain-containing protein n=1 Tax=Psychrobium sp. 1_MG-2023 TaxID=3062624 RepID=UPI000C332105|nr:diguanylate cyclase [Psychrobium sp. 1_MG-2023]MDP2561265.1 diguanylate cyclase [Psychrobium sp. 1_MG-2023]PKF55235.1 hypothetical protein CW748_13515 [Alteromonadales bacterium alter-6D02]
MHFFPRSSACAFLFLMFLTVVIGSELIQPANANEPSQSINSSSAKELLQQLIANIDASPDTAESLIEQLDSSYANLPKPERAKYLLLKAKFHISHEQFDKAILVLEQLTFFNLPVASYFRSLYLQTRVALHKQQYKKAFTLLLEIEQLELNLISKDHRLDYLMLATKLYAIVGEEEKSLALAIEAKAVAAASTDRDCVCSTEVLYTNTLAHFNKFELLKPAALNALISCPNNERYLIQRAHLFVDLSYWYRDKKRWLEHIAWLEQAVEVYQQSAIQPELNSALLLLANAYKKIGNLELRQQALSGVMAIDVLKQPLEQQVVFNQARYELSTFSFDDEKKVMLFKTLIESTKALEQQVNAKKHAFLTVDFKSKVESAEHDLLAAKQQKQALLNNKDSIIIWLSVISAVFALSVLVFYVFVLRRKQFIALSSNMQKDQLTQCFDPTSGMEQVNSLIEQQMDDSFCLACLRLNIDNMMQYNQICSYEIGDELLRTIGQNLLDNVQDNGIVIRDQGDNFLIIYIYHDESRRRELFTQLVKLSQSIQFNSNSMTLSFTVGWSERPTDKFNFEATLLEQVLGEAEDALLYAKKYHRGEWVNFSQKCEQIIAMRSDVHFNSHNDRHIEYL